jgi:Mn2+/Fe2+ NRAMP family transporter
MLLIMRMTRNRTIMGDAVNGRAINILGWSTTAAIFAATAGLVCTWFCEHFKCGRTAGPDHSHFEWPAPR